MAMKVELDRWRTREDLLFNQLPLERQTWTRWLQVWTR